MSTTDTPAKPAPAAAGYSPETRAREREQTDIPIGDRTFRRRRKTWDVARDLRALLREQGRAGARRDKLLEQLDDLDPDAQDRENIEGQAEDAIQASETIVYQTIALLLTVPDSDQGGEVDVEFLKANLDIEDAGGLVDVLTGRAEPDPTPPSRDS